MFLFYFQMVDRVDSITVYKYPIKIGIKPVTWIEATHLGVVASWLFSKLIIIFKWHYLSHALTTGGLVQWKRSHPWIHWSLVRIPLTCNIIFLCNVYVVTDNSNPSKKIKYFFLSPPFVLIRYNVLIILSYMSCVFLCLIYTKYSRVKCNVVINFIFFKSDLYLNIGCWMNTLD